MHAHSALTAGLSLLLVASCADAGARPAQHPGPAPERTHREDPPPPPARLDHISTVTTHTPSPPDRRARDRARCEEGDARSCHAAANDAYNRPPSPETDGDALRYFTRACEAGYAPSCNGLGVLHTRGRGVSQDDAAAFRLYRQACEAGASTACQHLAQALRSGRGTAPDPAAAERADARHRCVFQASLGNGTLAECGDL